MLTRCPSCQTTFKVTSDILQVADGQVRCGRCQLQFNALLHLLPAQREDAEMSIASRLVQPPRTPAPRAPEDQDFPSLRAPARPQEDDPHFIDTFDDLPFEEDAPSTPLHDEYEEPSLQDTVGYPEQTGADESDEARDRWLTDDPPQQPDDAWAADAPTPDDEPDPAQDAWLADPPPVDVPDTGHPGFAHGDTRPQQRHASPWSEPDTGDIEPTPDAVPLAGEAGSDAEAAAIAAEDARLQAQAEEIIAERRQRTVAWREPPPAQAPADEMDSELDLLAGTPRQRSSLIWKLLALPLAALLVVQVIHNYRATLARHPQWGEPLQQVYASLGLSLRPDWDLHAYEVRQWGVIADPATPGTLVVRASIKNLAAFAQPYPLLKLVLEDRWGEQVRARAFEPAEYLDALVAPERQLAPAQQVNATIAIVDPGPDAEGFRFDVCLRGAHGTVCAADLPKR